MNYAPGLTRVEILFNFGTKVGKLFLAFDLYFQFTRGLREISGVTTDGTRQMEKILYTIWYVSGKLMDLEKEGKCWASQSHHVSISIFIFDIKTTYIEAQY